MEAFKLTTSGVVALGVVGRGTIYAGSRVLIADRNKRIIKEEVAEQLEISGKSANAARDGGFVAIRLNNTTCEELRIGYCIIIE